MKKIIKKKTYNTETANIIDRKTSGEWGDADGYEEILYATKKGEYFIYAVGGAESKYPQENIIAVTKKEAEAFQK